MKGLIRYIGLILVSLFSICYASLSFAEPPVIGLVVWVTGTMKAAMPSSAPRILTRKSPIYESDTVSTDSSGSGEIVFTDNSILSIRNSTDIQIAKYHFGNNVPAKSSSETLNLLKGGFRTITGAITKANPDGYKANTPVATIGVAGTIYSAFYDFNEKALYAKLDRGIVYLVNDAGKVFLRRGLPPQNSKCPADIYGKVVSQQMPQVTCDEPQIFLSDPPLIPVAFPSGQGGTVGAFCVS